MLLLTPEEKFNFNINGEHYRIVQTKINSKLYLIAIVSTRQRWSWKNDVTKLETEIVQFLGNSTEDVTSQCNEWLKNNFSSDIYLLRTTSGNGIIQCE